MKTAPQPPRLSTWLMRLALHPDDRDCVLSDLAEEFESRATRDGTRAARRWYRAQVARSIRPSISRRLAVGDLSVVTEIKWVRRGIGARGWRAVMIVLLFAVALSANTMIFAAADAFVFHTQPYHQPDRLVIVERVGRNVSDYIWPQALAAWREQTDLFSGVHAHVFGASAYVTANGITESVRTEEITPGMLELLGVLPAWGRPFVDADAAASAAKVAIAGESLARRLFGEPRSAIGQSFFTGRDTVTIVGVMPASFRFPTAREELWRPLDISTWPTNSGVRDIARLADGQTLATAAEAVRSRAPAVRSRVQGPMDVDEMRLRAMAEVRGNDSVRVLFIVLVGAAACLLLIACANVASLEVAASSRRVRDFAIQSALGASRASLVRVTLGEGAVLLALSGAVAWVLTFWGLAGLAQQLSPAMRDTLTNPLDIDVRTFIFMFAIAAATWLLISLPSARRLSRLSIVDGLRDDSRTMPVTRAAARMRQLLMAGQVALTTLLLAGSGLYLRTYSAKLGLDKGLDDTNLATIVVTPAPDAPMKGGALERQILDRLRSTSMITGVARTDSLPPNTQSGIGARLTIDDREPTAERVMLHVAAVDPEYLDLAGIRIASGRRFESSSPGAEVVIDERLAQTYWPDRSPLGARFRVGTGFMQGVREFHVVGVSQRLRTDRLINDSNDQVYVAYMRVLADYAPLAFVARLRTPAFLPELDDLVRGVAGRSVVRIDTVSARYARLEANTRLMAAITTGFGAIALLVALAGVYALMAYLVAGRSREIAIRMALGADRRGVRRLILITSFRFVAAGLVAGSVAALAAASVLRAELFGVTPHDPTTYAGVAALIVVTALIASWWPARRASLVDPATALRQ